MWGGPLPKDKRTDAEKMSWCWTRDGFQALQALASEWLMKHLLKELKTTLQPHENLNPKLFNDKKKLDPEACKL